MAWFNEGLSSLKGQISNLTKEIVSPTLLSDNAQGKIITVMLKIIKFLVCLCYFQITLDMHFSLNIIDFFNGINDF